MTPLQAYMVGVLTGLGVANILIGKWRWWALCQGAALVLIIFWRYL